MSSRTLSSKVKIKTSELPPEVLGHYGFADDYPEFDLSRASGDRRQDQYLKDGITNALYRLELDSVKPGFDVLAQTGFRKGHYSRKRSPEEEVIFMASTGSPHRDKVKRSVRPYSYIEPRLLQSRGGSSFDVKLRKASPDRGVEIKDYIRREPTLKRPASTAWNYAEPTRYSFLQNTYPTYLRPIWEPEGGRVLSEYKDTVAAPKASSHHHGRWSVYGSTPNWTRSQSTPPDRYERSAGQVVRPPILGNRLTRSKNREYSIGVKLAESQTDLDTFNRLLDKKFGGRDSLPWRSNYSVYPLFTSAHYNYLAPRTNYEYNVYSPRTRVTRPGESVVYGCSDYDPYSSSYYSRHVPSTPIYRSEGFRNEPWYLPYNSRSGYYSSVSYPSPSVGRYTTRYLY